MYIAMKKFHQSELCVNILATMGQSPPLMEQKAIIASITIVTSFRFILKR